MNTPTPLGHNAPPALGLPVADDAPVCDTSLKFVRVLEERTDGLVGFEFSIGWPELAVELLLPAPAFAEFCATHRVQRLDH
ncbi:MAG: phenol hydroxylase subunit [Rhodoferax sp.]